MELRWKFHSGRRVPAFAARLSLGDLVWVRIGDYRRRCRVVAMETGDPPTGAYTEIRLGFFDEDRPEEMIPDGRYRARGSES